MDTMIEIKIEIKDYKNTKESKKEDGWKKYNEVKK